MTARRRDPANEVYDRACQLLHAAQGLRRAAAATGSSPAIAASLGCLEAALDQLVAAAADLGRVASMEAGDPSATDVQAVFERLTRQLRLAESTCGAARERTGPLLAASETSA